jgi:hypothetical protein
MAAICSLLSSPGLKASSLARDRVVQMLMVSLFQTRIGNRTAAITVRVDNEWVDVPDDAVITEPNLVGRTMVWPVKRSLGISIRCFMPGSMT